MKAEHARIGILAANRRALVFRTGRMAGILQDLEAVFVGQRAHFLQVAGHAGEIDRDNDVGQRAGFLRRGQFLSQPFDRHVPAVGIDIDEIDRCAAIKRAIGRGDETDRAGPDPAARTYAHGKTRDVQRGGGVRQRHGVGHLVTRGERLFEPFDRRPLSQEIGCQDLDYGIDVRLFDLLAAIGDEIRHVAIRAQSIVLPMTCSSISERSCSTERKSGFEPLS